MAKKLQFRDNMSRKRPVQACNLVDSACFAFGSQDANSQAGMQDFNKDWLASEHQRLHNVELWPDSPRKQAAIGAIQSTLESLSRHPGAAEANFTCFLCESRKTKLIVLEPREYREPAPILDHSTEWEKTG
jgi:hypothetical protein